MKKQIKKIIGYLKENRRYLWVFLVLILIFLINKSFPAEVITSDDCANGDCQIEIDQPSMEKDDTKFYVNDIFSSNSHEFYRLIFQVKSNQKTKLEIYTTNVLDQDKEVKEISIENPGEKNIFEAVFETDQKYSDLLFKKADPNDSSQIFINQINLSKLNVANEKEINKLKPTIIGGADLEVKDQEQLKNNYRFDQLKENNVLFGQTFKPQFNFLTGIELDLDIIKQDNSGGKKYALELREVEYESIDVPDIQSHPIATVKFSLNDLEAFREPNGKYFFPILARVKKDKSYFFGINNDRVDVDEFNHLLVRGTRDEPGYSQGTTAVKYKNASYAGPGDFYFKTFGFELKTYKGTTVLPGSIIEDRGDGKLFFSYRSPGGQLEMINLEDRTENVYFDDNKKAIAGDVDEENPAFFTYHFETIYSFSNFSFSAQKGDVTWNKNKISYSFDNHNWTIIPQEEDLANQDGLLPQITNFSADNSKLEKEIYIKIEPDWESTPRKSKFGIKNLFFQAELISK